MGGISIPSLVLIVIIILLLFGTKKLRSLGSDLGSAVKGFQKSVKDSDSDKLTKSEQDADFNSQSINDKQQDTAEKDK